MKDSMISAAFVSTNSITQGEQVEAIWKPLIIEHGMHINFAYRTFRWDSEANAKAHVHCVVIGISHLFIQKQRFIIDNNKIYYVKNINPYLINADNIFISRRSTAISDCEEMLTGSEPRDGGYLLISTEEREIIRRENQKVFQYVLRFITGDDFINNQYRYCLWLKDAPLDILRTPYVRNRLELCKQFREKSKQAQAHKMADYPALFVSERQPTTDYLLIPQASSERRRYIPIGYMDPKTIVSNTCFTIANATRYSFGILTSNVHMAWMSTVCGRLKSDYRYSNTIVYNNFPWPDPTDEQKAKIEQTAQRILDARALYPDSSLADLYDPLTMPVELRKAHEANDRAVMQAYGFSIKEMSEADCVAELMRMYQKLAVQ